MPTHKRDLTALSITDCAWLARCAKETASKRLKEAGVEPVRQDGRTIYYDPREAVPVLLGVEKLDLSAERARLAKEQADAQQMKNAELRGEMVLGSEVEVFLAGLFSAVRMKVLAVPAKAAPEAHGAGSIAETESVIRGFLVETLETLSAGEWIRSRGGGKSEAA
jgi:phage terminase Nu1 subunit (DNA packaging protein)